MSMLAEPRRKQKWSLNPRGKHWSEDQNKFGQKMLEKMGWSSGKGLGANEQGMTEHVRVAVKNNTAGFGYSTDKQDQAWTEQQENFNDFLQQLQNNQNSNVSTVPENPVETLSGKSLELKSKQSRARVHYRKFTRGKDVNKYSAKDLANIFGQKDLTEKVVKQEEEEEYVPEAIGSVDKTGGICTVNSGNISDYLKKKNFNYVKNEERKDNRNSNSESEAEQYVGFGFTSFTQTDSTNLKESNYAFDNPCLNVIGSIDSSSPAPKAKSSKRRKKEFAFENGGLDLNFADEFTAQKVSKSASAINENNATGFVNDALNLEAQTDESHNGKEFEVSRSQFGLSNNALDLTDESVEKKRVTFNERVEFSTDSSTKKRKTALDKFEVESGKRKKKRKLEECEDNSASMGFINTALDIDAVSDEVNDNKENEQKIKKAKRKKNRTTSNLETIQEVVDEDKGTQDNVPVETITLEESIEEIPQVDLGVINRDISKKKKKKHTEKRTTENISVIDVEHETEVFEVDEAHSYINTEKTKVAVEEITVCKEKKKKKKKEHKTKPITDTKCIDSNDEATLATHNGSIEDNGAKKKKKRKKSSIKTAENAEEIIPDLLVTDKEKASQDLVEDDSEAKVTKMKKLKKSKVKVDPEAELSVNGESQVREEYNEVHVQNKQSPWRGRREYINRFNANRSPWAGKAKMSKRMLMTFFHRNLIQDFPGANVFDITGYAADIDCNV